MMNRTAILLSVASIGFTTWDMAINQKRSDKQDMELIYSAIELGHTCSEKNVSLDRCWERFAEAHYGKPM